MESYSLSFKRTSNRYSLDDLFLNLETVWTSKGAQPTTTDMQCYPSSIHFGTYYNRFGSWKNALHEFVKYKNEGREVREEIKNISTKRRTLNNSLRYDIMKKDNFKCRLCGNSPAIDSSVTLEIDHKIPLTKGGLNSIDNLQTTCKKCNSGKMNKSP